MPPVDPGVLGLVAEDPGVVGGREPLPLPEPLAEPPPVIEAGAPPTGPV
jgi:hypothetical protein